MAESQVSRDQILDEIRHLAMVDGRSPGRRRFEEATGIRSSEWSGKFWARWGDALTEAGLQPNKFMGAIPDDELLRHLARCTQELGHFPTQAELGVYSKSRRDFPSDGTFQRLGNRRERIRRLLDYCSDSTEYQGLCPALRTYLEQTPLSDNASAKRLDPESAGDGTVYLLRSGKHYKVGRSNDAGRRQYEIKLQLPDRVDLVHAITTDDPVGIERYWHERFADKRRNGEWFDLTASEVSAFRRRRFM